MNKEFDVNKIEGDKNKKFLEAQKNLRRIQEEISPYIKKRIIKENLTAGEWCETSSLMIG